MPLVLAKKSCDMLPGGENQNLKQHGCVQIHSVLVTTRIGGAENSLEPFHFRYSERAANAETTVGPWRAYLFLQSLII